MHFQDISILSSVCCCKDTAKVCNACSPEHVIKSKSDIKLSFVADQKLVMFAYYRVLAALKVLPE